MLNGDFETGTFDGWDITGWCAISNATVHNGSYSAYISDVTYDDLMVQVIYTRVHLSADSGAILEGWIYHSKVGLVGGHYPYSGICLRFYNTSTMQRAFDLIYTWCMSQLNQNGLDLTWYLLLPMNVSEWNFLHRNITADIYSTLGNIDFSNIALRDVRIIYHYSDESPGAFYARSFCHREMDFGL